MQLLHQTDIGAYECAFQVLHKLRAAAGQRELDKLSGTVEVDEVYIGAERPGRGGRGAKGKALVVAAVEVRGRASGRARLRRIPNVKGATLQQFLKDHVARGSTVKTDGWSGYRRIESVGYRHDRVVEGTSHEVAEKWLPHVHRIFGNLKTWLNGTHHGVSPKHMQAYLNEFVFRFNRRKNPKAAFRVLLDLAGSHRAPTYEELYRAGTSKGWRHPNPLGVGEK